MYPIPAKLAKISRWEYADFWTRPKDQYRQMRQGRKVTEVLQCYSSFVAVLAPGEAQVVPTSDCKSEPGLRGPGLGAI